MNDTEMKQFALMSLQPNDCVAQTFTSRQLPECHRTKLNPAGKLLDLKVTVEPFDAFVELVFGQ
jgi:hypothetical protein